MVTKENVTVLLFSAFLYALKRESTEQTKQCLDALKEKLANYNVKG